MKKDNDNKHLEQDTEEKSKHTEEETIASIVTIVGSGNKIELSPEQIGLIIESQGFSPANLFFKTREHAEEELILTPSVLGKVIHPYLKAIDNLQQVIDELKHKPGREIVIRSISYHSPVSVSLDGADEAIKTIQDIIIPWRRQHSAIMASLAEQEKQVDIETKRAEVLEKRGSAARNRAEEEKVKMETEKLRLENEKLRVEVQHAKVNLALNIISTIAPNLSETSRIEYIIKLLPTLDVIGLGDYEVQSKGVSS